MENIPTPAEWAFARAKSGKRLWVEDDARPIDAESMSNAWKRLFGEPMPQRQECLIYMDLGDTFYQEYKDGRVAIIDPCTSEIHQLPPNTDPRG